MAVDLTRRAFVAGAVAAAAVAPVAAEAAFDANAITFEAAPAGIPCIPGADIIIDSGRFGDRVAYWFADHGFYVLGADGQLVELGEPITVNEGDEIAITI